MIGVGMTIKKIYLLFIISPLLSSVSMAQTDSLMNPDKCVPSTLYVGFREGSSTLVGSSQKILDYIVKTAISENSYVLLEGHFDTNEKNANRNLSLERMTSVIKDLVKNGVPENHIWTRDGFDNYEHIKGFKGRYELYSSVSVIIPKQYRSCWIEEENKKKSIIKNMCFGIKTDSECLKLLDGIGYGGK
ncbi:OmpA family protein [Acetobacter sp.]|jgi:hypothetical protein|uniref:OmpA family protein n=1 Tax=Acetobacter sp. TaxID=440 RepID=UPI0025C6C30F|nr:OmpA family protein [Acetobacter sp.]MCH4090111.1 OmpA family protein [Acetobacter sp.]MCI1298807.1 OmpA family protein [Acetobacter sp.]MCI1314826.1 OmpA family protein [Acetobacter sp.]